jgi:hypothetical protein
LSPVYLEAYGLISCRRSATDCKIMCLEIDSQLDREDCSVKAGEDVGGEVRGGAVTSIMPLVNKSRRIVTQRLF